MQGQNASFAGLGVHLLLLLIAIALAIVGLVLRRTGKLRGRGAAIGWIVLCAIPLILAAVWPASQRGPTVASPPTVGTDLAK